MKSAPALQPVASPEILSNPEFRALLARRNRFSNHTYMPPRSTITMTLRLEPQLYGRLAAQVRRDGHSLNRTTVGLLECALDAWDEG
jgi:hypothetical protein